MSTSVRVTGPMRLLLVSTLLFSCSVSAKTFNEWAENFSPWPDDFNKPAKTSTIDIDALPRDLKSLSALAETSENVERSIVGRRCGPEQLSVSGCDFYLKMGNIFHHLVDCEIVDVELALTQDRSNFSVENHINDRRFKLSYPDLQPGADFYCPQSTQVPNLGKVYQFTGTPGDEVDIYVPAEIAGRNAYYRFQGKQCMAGFYRQLVSQGREVETIINLTPLGSDPHIFDLDCYEPKPAYSLYLTDAFFDEQNSKQLYLLLLGYQHHGVVHYLPIWRVDGRELAAEDLENISGVLQQQYDTGPIEFLPQAEYNRIGRYWIDLCLDSPECPATSLSLATFSEQFPQNVTLTSIDTDELSTAKKLDRYFNEYEVVGIDSIDDTSITDTLYFQSCDQQELRQFGITVSSDRLSHIEVENFIEPGPQQPIFSCRDIRKGNCTLDIGGSITSDELYEKIAEGCIEGSDNLTLLFDPGSSVIDGLYFDQRFSPVHMRGAPGGGNLAFGDSSANGTNPGVKTQGTRLLISDLSLYQLYLSDSSQPQPPKAVIRAEQNSKLALNNVDVTVGGTAFDIMSVSDTDLIVNSLKIVTAQHALSHSRAVVTQSTSTDRGTAAFIENITTNGSPMLVLDYQAHANVINADITLDPSNPRVFEIGTDNAGQENIRIGNVAVRQVPDSGRDFDLVGYTGWGRGFLSFPEEGLRLYTQSDDLFALDLTLEDNREKYFNCSGVGKLQLGAFFAKSCLDYPYQVFNVLENGDFSGVSWSDGKLNLNQWSLFWWSGEPELSQEVENSVTVNINEGGTHRNNVLLFQDNIRISKDQCYMLKFTARAQEPRPLDLEIYGDGGSLETWFEEDGEGFTLNTFNQTFIRKFSTSIDASSATLFIALGGHDADVTLSNFQLYRLDQLDRCTEDVPPAELNKRIEPNLTVRSDSFGASHLVSLPMQGFRYFNHYDFLTLGAGDTWEACELACLDREQCAAWTFADDWNNCFFYNPESMLQGKEVAEQPWWYSGYKEDFTAFTPCATEGEYCSFTGTREVRYGADGSWVFLIATDGIACDNATFGDPAPNIVKRCEYRDIE